jgi:hypothetical protein
MGRCTRNATDFAIIIWLGQSLVNSATSPPLLKSFPAELAAEIRWGVQQSELASTNPAALVEMILGLIGDTSYRKGADATIEGIKAKQPEPALKDYEEAGPEEVRYARAMWEENFPHAHEIARQIADKIISPELSGYRAWWSYLASVAASLTGDRNAEQDCLKRGSKCGINSGWLNRLLQERKAIIPEKSEQIQPNAEGVWDTLTGWGWAGPHFDGIMGQMLSKLSQPYHVGYHEGLEILGKCFGARTTRTTEPGAPDVVWSFPDDFHITFEAKTEKNANGELSKKDVQNAKGHPEWVRAKLCKGVEKVEIAPIVVAPSPKTNQIALPFAEGLLYVSPDKILKLAAKVADGLRGLRVKFSGRDYPGASVEFSAEMRNSGLDMESVKSALLSEPLKK